MQIEVLLTPIEIGGKPRPIGDERRVSLSPARQTHGQRIILSVPGAEPFVLDTSELKRALIACEQDQ